MNFEWAREWLKPFNVGDMDAVMSFYADDAVVHTVSGETFVADKAKVRAMFALFCNVDPKNGTYRFEPVAYYGNEKEGSIPFTWRGKTGADFMGIPVTPGTEIDALAVSVHKYRDGKIVWEGTYWDPMTIFKQVGMWQTIVTSVTKK